jgi:hypothetical protein
MTLGAQEEKQWKSQSSLSVNEVESLSAKEE